jgi:hypothetical protein
MINPARPTRVASVLAGRRRLMPPRWRAAAAVVSVLGAGGTAAALILLLAVAAIVAGAPTQATAQATGIPAVVLAAYLNAEQMAPTVAPGCEVRWPVIAGIWRVESVHGTYGGRTVTPAGDVTPPLYGATLDGSTPGTAIIPDTDDGKLDADPVWDRAVGPAQFLPSSWQALGRDGNTDGVADPQNVYDAAVGTVAHLCVWSPGNYQHRDELEAAIYRYNNDPAYVATVLGWIDYYTAYTLLDGDVVASGLYAFPLPHNAVTVEQIRATHHDYPAWDAAVPEGTPVYAAHPGQVTALSAPCGNPATCRCGYGIHIEGHDQHRYTYCHGSAIPHGITPGVEVAAGQLILLTGNTGNSTGPHLHFQIRSPAGDLLCPQPLLEAWWNGTALIPVAAPTAGCTH